MKKSLIMIFCPLACILLFSGCGVKAISDEQIFQDFKELGINSHHNVTFEKFEILKRMTNVDDKVDQVFLWVSGENGEVTFEAGYELIYLLYNDGWQLETYHSFEGERTSYVSPVSGVNQEVADAYMATKYPNATFKGQDLDLKKGRCTFQYDVDEYFDYMTETTTIELTYTFDDSVTWKWEETPRESKLSETETWDISGTWTYSYYNPPFLKIPATEVTAKITVESYDGAQWAGSYSIQYDQYEHFSKTESGKFKTENGKFLHTIAEYITGDCVVGFKFDKEDGVLCIHSHGGNYGNEMIKEPNS